MESVSYFEAWRLWAAGELGPDVSLWGLDLWWWGRIGRIVALVSGLAVLAEIAGTTRLRSIGDWLGEIPVPKGLIEGPFVGGVEAAVFLWDHSPFTPSRPPDRYSDYPGWRKFTLVVAFAVMVLLALAGLLDRYVMHIPLVGFDPDLPWWGDLAAYFAGWLGSVLIPLAISIVASIPAILVWGAEIAIIHRLADLLDSPNIGNIIRAMSVLLLLAGFHFDFLAS